MPRIIHSDYTYNDVNTSKQIGNIRSDVIESYKVYHGDKKPVLESKIVDTYYVDEFTGERKGSKVKSSTYYYDDAGALKEAFIKRQNNKLYDSLIKSKLGNGSWLNEQIETNYLSAFADETGIKDASLRSSYLNKAHIDALPTNIRKTVYAALDFLMENIKKVR